MTDRVSKVIGGNWVAPESDTWIDVVSPTDGSVFTDVGDGSAADVDHAVPALTDKLVRDTGTSAALATAMQAFTPGMHLRAFADMEWVLAESKRYDVAARQHLYRTRYRSEGRRVRARRIPMGSRLIGEFA